LIQATKVSTAVHQGDLKQRITCTHERHTSLPADSPFNLLKNSMNVMADHVEHIVQAVNQVARDTHKEGKLGLRAEVDVDKTDGVWRELVVNLNSMTQSNQEQVRDIAEVSTAVANGDLSKKITVDVKGETLLLKNTINTMGNVTMFFFFATGFLPCISALFTFNFYPPFQ
jgi:osomolarity two-component system, sensor histidine kinase NIK1